MTVKIRFQLQILAAAAIIFSTTDLPAQDTVLNKHGLWVIKDVRSYNATIKYNRNKQMVDIKKSIPDIILDIRYATTKNFMHTKLYPVIKTTYLRYPAAQALHSVQKELNKIGLALKIYDAYRPYS